jgi:hypothetical protein
MLSPLLTRDEHHRYRNNCGGRTPWAALMSRGSRYRSTAPIAIAWPTSRPESYEKNLSRSIPASDSVRTHSASTSSVIVFSTLNSPATWPTGFVMDTTTTRTSWRKTGRRNSYRFVPAKIASAYSGFMDNSAVRKAATKHTADGLPVRSFRTLPQELATLTRNQVRLDSPSFHLLATPTPLQNRAFQLLQLAP